MDAIRAYEHFLNGPAMPANIVKRSLKKWDAMDDAAKRNHATKWFNARRKVAREEQARQIKIMFKLGKRMEELANKIATGAVLPDDVIREMESWPKID